MFEKFNTIRIQGKCFENDAELNFFGDNEQLCIIYGRNGSGKSTISEAFANIANENISDAVRITQPNLNELNDDIKNNLHIFNENFIDKYIKINGSGIKTIVLFGKQGNIQEEIENKEKILEEKTKERDNSNTKKEKYENQNDTDSPKYWENMIKENLRNGWANRDKDIKNNQRASSVNDEILNRISQIEIDSTCNYENLLNEFNEKLKYYKSISSDDTFPLEIQGINFNENIEQNITNLLSKIIEKAEFTDRENRILQLVKQNLERLEVSKKLLEENEICPYCFQQIDDNHKKDMSEIIKKILNKDIEEHKQNLLNSKIAVIPFLDENLAKLNLEKYNDIKNLIVKCNKIIENYNNLIDKKFQNPFETISLEINTENSYIENVKTLNEKINYFEQERKEFQNNKNEADNKKDELISLNDKISRNDIENSLQQYNIKQQEKTNLQTNIDNLNSEIQNLKDERVELRAQKANVVLATDEINKMLQYIFFSKQRIKIEPNNEGYELKINDKSVEPKKISIGERNAVALCYFFTKIFENTEVEKLYQNPKFLVIDDPMSSFDFENKIGIMSFLHYQINKIIKGNPNSKVIILSHDLTSIFDLSTIKKEVVNKENFFELNNTELKKIEKLKHKNEYKTLLEEIYDYALNKPKNKSLTIGNQMRKALEAFSTFNYQEGIAEISRNENIIKDMPHKEYFENLMYRLVLHGESHKFWNFVSDDEKQRTAKEVLCFMYELFPNHIEAYLNKKNHNNDKINNIKIWLENL